MNENFKESFEKTRLAGIIAAGALDEVAKIAIPGTRTDELTSCVMSFLMIMVLTLLHFFIEDFLNHVVPQQTM